MAESYKKYILTKNGFTLTLYVPEGFRDGRAIVYHHTDEAGGDEIYPLIREGCSKRSGKKLPVFAAVSGEQWNRDLSPWYQERVFRDGEDFTGGADAYLDTFVNVLVKKTEAFLSALPESGAESENPGLFAGFTPSSRILSGYSLAGLFAAYAPFKTDIFTRIASVSGSLWFDGFTGFTESTPLQGRVDRAYFSVGDREKKTNNPRMKTVEECMEKVRLSYAASGAETFSELNPGNHFVDVSKRIAKGILRCL